VAIHARFGRTYNNHVKHCVGPSCIHIEGVVGVADNQSKKDLLPSQSVHETTTLLLVYNFAKYSAIIFFTHRLSTKPFLLNLAINNLSIP